MLYPTFLKRTSETDSLFTKVQTDNSEKTAVAMKPKLYALACRWYHNAQQAPLPKKIGSNTGDAPEMRSEGILVSFLNFLSLNNKK